MHQEQLKQRSENLRKANAKLTPEQNGILEKIASVLNSFNPDDLYENPTADKLIPHLEAGLLKLKSHPEHYKQFDASNGWGTYKDFVPFVEEILDACKEHPKANVRTWI